MNDTKETKNIKRRALITTREALSPMTREAAEKIIRQRVRDWLQSLSVQTVAGYLPTRGEVDLRALLTLLRRDGIKIALPVAEQTEAPLVFRQWDGEALSERDVAGMRAPLHGARLEPQAILVPCVGFTDNRYRLGYGGGYYDRTLAKWPGVPAAGIAFMVQRTNFVPDEHDVPLSIIITERVDAHKPLG
jgi:5-formyltetrahydrofolate cyclo-ligase